MAVGLELVAGIRRPMKIVEFGSLPLLFLFVFVFFWV